MDASLNYNEEYNYDTDEVRPPDKVKNERLIENNMDDFDKEINEALYLSMEEFANQEIMNEIYEKELINNFIIETVKRREKFKELLIKMNSLIKIYSDIKEVYEIIEPIIYTYCEQHIEKCEIDEKTYNKIFKTLSTIRVNSETIQLLKTIIHI
jgi:hypothetical protein